MHSSPQTKRRNSQLLQNSVNSMTKTTILQATTANINTVATALKQGDVVGMPTETVYGLAANALDPQAVERIFAVKGRPADNPLIVHISDLANLTGVVSQFSATAQKLADAFWPGPLTMILPKDPGLCDIVTAGLDTVGVRMPSHPVAKALIEASGLPIAAPSANTSGKPSPTTAEHVYHDLNGKLDYILDGGSCSVGLESTVAMVLDDGVTILRPGAVTKEDFEQVVTTVTVDPAVLQGVSKDEAVASPGMKYQHYAPSATLTLVHGNFLAFCLHARQHDAAVLVFEGEEQFFTEDVFTYGKQTDSASQAEELFDALRQIDQSGCTQVLVRMPAMDGMGLAVYNRLLRACAFREITVTAPFVIGLTGPTGSGKSLVADYFKAHYGTVLDCDIMARQAVEQAHVLTQLQQAFGADLLVDGVLDRKLLASRAFASEAKHQMLNRIMYPAIAGLLLTAIESTTGVVLMDAPTLFESGVDQLCQSTVAVIAPKQIRLQRILVRDHLTMQQAIARMQVQLTEEFYEDRAQYTLENRASKQLLLQKAGELFDQLAGDHC